MQVDELKDYIKSLPLSEVVGKYISLNKKGGNHEGLCPFHDDHDPSLKVSDSKGLYKCFVCGEAGDAISFVEKFRNKGFVETLKELADVFGVSFEDNRSSQKLNPRFETAFRILTAAQAIYFSYPRETKAKVFRDFIVTRKISEEIANQFQLGFAPSDKNHLVDFLTKKDQENPKQHILNIAEEIGVIKKTKRGLSDTFRGRIIFPIWDHSGQVRGFGSRATNDQQLPKYLNSKESFVFNKKKILFGFHLAKAGMRETGRVILTEGYMDTITMHQFDFKESIAIMGIALSDEKCSQLKNTNHQIYFAFDNDKAGLQAGIRANENFLKLGLLPFYINLSPFKDPDELLQEKGRLELQKRIEQAKIFTDFLIEKKIHQNFGDNTDLKIKTLNEIFQLLSPLKLSIQATERLVAAAAHLGLKSSAETLIDNYKNYLAGLKPLRTTHSASSVQPQSTKTDILSGQNNSESIQAQRNVARKAENPLSPIDRWILHCALCQPSIILKRKFTEILDFATNKGTNKFILKLGNCHLTNDQNEYTKLISQILHEESYGSAFNNYIYSVLYSEKLVTQTDEDSEGQLLFDLKNKVTMERLKIKKKKLMQSRLELTHKEEIDKTDELIMEINKKITDLKNKRKFTNSNVSDKPRTQI
ncbi:MAG: DNA primase [Halobacteriovoraceae bacterium]|nr:DNA primase [Halobacteriovoraceae bacterium]